MSNNKSSVDARSNSGVRAKRTKAIQTTPDSGGNSKRKIKSAKRRGGKGKSVSTSTADGTAAGTAADPPLIESENTALISG